MYTVLDRKGVNNIRDRKIIGIRPSPDVDRAIELLDQDRNLGNRAKKIPTRYELYVRTIEEASRFLSIGDRGDLVYEDPNVPFRYHSVVINLDNDEFEGDEITKFTDILRVFDSIDFVGSSSGDIKIVLIFYGIYEN